MEPIPDSVINDIDMNMEVGEKVFLSRNKDRVIVVHRGWRSIDYTKEPTEVK